MLYTLCFCFYTSQYTYLSCVPFYLPFTFDEIEVRIIIIEGVRIKQGKVTYL